MLAKDPVAAADFFDFCITSLFKHLLGWDYNLGSSAPNGGILGELGAFYGTTEFTERGCLHGHILIWLKGAPNPSDVHRRLKESPEFQKRFFDFFETIIHHHLPDADIYIDSACDPRTERPPLVPAISSLSQSASIKPDLDDKSDTKSTCANEDEMFVPICTERDVPLPENANSHNCGVPLPSHGSDPCSRDPFDILDEWDTVYVTEVKKCGELLQHHTCWAVCHKYGNESKCRFLFPHEIVDASYYDPETKSVVLLCRDGTVNYFNPYILIFCRHNHDLKCILSGKGAKAAMFYITDYITKMSLNTYETLSLMSRAVARISDDNTSAPLAAARLLLHKCLSQFTRQQQIHAQQAVRYLRGFNDTISSHKTVPMLSGLLLSFVKDQYHLRTNGPSSANTMKSDQVGLNSSNCESLPHSSSGSDQPITGSDEVDDDDVEPIPLRIAINRSGALIDTTQVQHYWLRNEALNSMTFYDFCRFTKIEKKSHNKSKNTHDTRLGVLRRYDFLPDHPLFETHQLVEHTNPATGDGNRVLVPRVIGATIPRKSSEIWPLFVLIHFKPFSATNPLLIDGMTCREAFDSYEFASGALRIMKNWEAIHECEDERDADRLKKRAAITKESQSMTRTLALDGSSNPEDVDLSTNTMSAKVPPEQEFRTLQTVSLLQNAGWFTNIAQDHTQITQIPASADLATCGGEFTVPDPLSDDGKGKALENLTLTPTICNIWKKSIKNQEKTLSDCRKNALNPESQNTGSLPDRMDVDGTTACFVEPAYLNSAHGETLSKSQTPMISQGDVLAAIENEFSLNLNQSRAFRIISNHYIERYINSNLNEKPLRMLMTGPGGTGKTHVVKAVKRVMANYGCGHRIRFLAPTGSAASNIDGMTVHKGLGIKIAKKDGRGKGGREIGESAEDLTVLVSVQNKAQLHDEWRNVDVVLIDEVSLTSAQLLCEIDQALRFAKEVYDEWFGGITVIFAGDFYQYPPVGGTPLYAPISATGKQTSEELLKRLGRLAWKSISTVVELTEQQRMKNDIEYSQAVQRLRVRQCTSADVDLFNSRVIKSVANIDGIICHPSSAAIVGTNHLREVLNSKKAHSIGGNKLVVCASRDIVPTSAVLSSEEYQSLLKLDFAPSKHQGALLGFLPLYEMMPVVLRLCNLSTELKITNSSQGIVRKIFIDTDEYGYTYCRCAVVEFKDSPVRLDGLPPGYFPIFPTTFSYPKKMKVGPEGHEEIVRVCRHQLPIQPGFAVTGHSAQGKTLPNILAFLNEGGFAAYVAASRATSRHGLCIAHPVTLKDLNKPLPSDLFYEVQRLDALRRNTLVKHGFVQGQEVPVPDPEAETSNRSAAVAISNVKIEFLGLCTPTESRGLKRKHSQDALELENARLDRCLPDKEVNRSAEVVVAGNHFGSEVQPLKKLRLQLNSSSETDCQLLGDSNQLPSFEALNAGCQWSASNWSCAYDTVFMSLFVGVSHMDSTLRSVFREISATSRFLLDEFNVLQRIQSTGQFNESRDRLHDLLFAQRPAEFPRSGHVGASAASILDTVFPFEKRYCHLIAPCSASCLLVSNILGLILPSFFTENTGHPISIDDYLREYLLKQCSDLGSGYPEIDHSNCASLMSDISSGSEERDSAGISGIFTRVRQSHLGQCCPIIFFEVPPANVLIYPSPYLAIPCTSYKCRYRLAAIIYHGDFHFCARLLLHNHSLWMYDGQTNNGTPILEHPDFGAWHAQGGSLSLLTSLGSKKAHIYIYVHIERRDNHHPNT